MHDDHKHNNAAAGGQSSAASHEDQNHSHDAPHDHHGHSHTPQETKAVLDRLSRAIGHLESVKRMVADERDCSEVLIQLSAVRAAINKTGLLLLQSHLDHCIVEAVQSGDMETVRELGKAIEQYLK